MTIRLISRFLFRRTVVIVAARRLQCMHNDCLHLNHFTTCVLLTLSTYIDTNQEKWFKIDARRLPSLVVSIRLFLFASVFVSPYLVSCLFMVKRVASSDLLDASSMGV